MRAITLYQEEPTDIPWTRPIEGVIAYVDLIERRVLHFADHGGDPIPPRQPNLAEGAWGPVRTSLRPLAITQPDGPSFQVDGARRRVGGLVVPHRLRRPRGPRAAPARLRRRRPGPPDRPPRVGVRDGRAVRRPAPDALLDQLLRRGRVRPRPPGQHAHARLRLPRRDPLLRRRLRRRPGPAGRAPEGRVPPRGGRRRAVEAPGLLQRHQRGAPLPPPRHLVVGGDRELRLRLLLVPVPGRHDRVRHQAHRDRVRRRHPRRRRSRGAGHAGAVAPRTTSTCSTSAST